MWQRLDPGYGYSGHDPTSPTVGASYDQMDRRLGAEKWLVVANRIRLAKFTFAAYHVAAPTVITFFIICLMKYNRGAQAPFVTEAPND